MPLTACFSLRCSCLWIFGASTMLASFAQVERCRPLTGLIGLSLTSGNRDSSWSGSLLLPICSWCSASSVDAASLYSSPRSTKLLVCSRKVVCSTKRSSPPGKSMLRSTMALLTIRFSFLQWKRTRKKRRTNEMWTTQTSIDCLCDIMSQAIAWAWHQRCNWKEEQSISCKSCENQNNTLFTNQ